MVANIRFHFPLRLGLQLFYNRQELFYNRQDSVLSSSETNLPPTSFRIISAIALVLFVRDK
jgi:hypothetical protein